MHYLEWHDTFSVGISHLDEHHQQLLDLLNKTHRILAAPAEANHIHSILQELFEYVEVHFAAEEEWMAIIDYPLQEQHLVQHEDFLGGIRSIRTMLQSGEADTGSAVLEMFIFLQNWLVNHIISSDRMIAGYVNTQAA